MPTLTLETTPNVGNYAIHGVSGYIYSLPHEIGTGISFFSVMLKAVSPEVQRLVAIPPREKVDDRISQILLLGNQCGKERERGSLIVMASNLDQGLRGRITQRTMEKTHSRS